jgi:hypothetical protein
MRKHLSAGRQSGRVGRVSLHEPSTQLRHGLTPVINRLVRYLVATQSFHWLPRSVAEACHIRIHGIDVIKLQQSLHHSLTRGKSLIIHFHLRKINRVWHGLTARYANMHSCRPAGQHTPSVTQEPPAHHMSHAIHRSQSPFLSVLAHLSSALVDQAAQVLIDGQTRFFQAGQHGCKVLDLRENLKTSQAAVETLAPSLRA